MSVKRYFKIEYDEEWYLFDSTTISKQLVEEQAEYEKIEKKQGYGYTINKYPINVFCEAHWFGETVKHQEFREDGLYEWTGDDWVKL